MLTRTIAVVVVVSILTVCPASSRSKGAVASADTLQKTRDEEFHRWEVGLQLGVMFGLTAGVHVDQQTTVRAILFVLPKVATYDATIQYRVYASAAFDVYPLLHGGVLRVAEDRYSSTTGHQETQTHQVSVIGFGLGGEYVVNDSRTVGFFVDVVYDHLSGGSSGGNLTKNLDGSFATFDIGVRYHF